MCPKFEHQFPPARAVSKGGEIKAGVSVCKMKDDGRLPADSVAVDIAELREPVAGSSSGSMDKETGE